MIGTEVNFEKLRAAEMREEVLLSLCYRMEDGSTSRCATRRVQLLTAVLPLTFGGAGQR